MGSGVVGVLEGAVVERYLETFTAKASGGEQRLQRRIRLHLARLLPIEVEMVAVR